MNDKKLEQILSELSAIKRLLILFLQQEEVKIENIAKALGVSVGRVSQMAPIKKYRKRKGVENG